MSDIIQEVDDALKQEKLAKLWQQYGNYIIASLVLVILMTAVKSGYEYYHRTTSEKATSALMLVIEGVEDADKTAELTEYLKTAKGGAALLAQLHLAGSYINENKVEDAHGAYLAIANNAKAPSYFQDFGTLMALQLEMDKINGADDENLAPLMDKLSMLADNEKSVWRFHARLNRAALYALQSNFQDAMKDTDSVLGAAQMPPTLTRRANSLHQLYKVKSLASES